MCLLTINIMGENDINVLVIHALNTIGVSTDKHKEAIANTGITDIDHIAIFKNGTFKHQLLERFWILFKLGSSS